jgi:hypothetical protein
MYCQAQIEGRKECFLQCEHCKLYYQFLENAIEEGDMVTELNYGAEGVVEKVFENWDDLKNNSNFLTLDPDGIANSSDFMELLINGDPRDEWLKMQKIPFTADQLLENWFLVRIFEGGAIWTCRSLLKLSDKSS